MKFNEVEKFIMILVAVMVAVSVIMICEMLSTAEAEGIRMGYVLCDPDSYVNIRYEPGKCGSVIARYECGDEMRLDGVEKGDWVHVVQMPGGDEGWINRLYVSQIRVRVGEFRAKVNARNVRVRNGIGGRILRRLKKGTEVTVLATSEGWSVTTQGYIMSDFLTPVDELAREND